MLLAPGKVVVQDHRGADGIQNLLAAAAKGAALVQQVGGGAGGLALVPHAHGQAFTAAFGSFGPKFIAISILLFAYSTTLGWSHYGTKAVEYLFGTTGSRIYKVVFVGMTVVGSTMKLGLAWDLSDTFNGLMMIPNLIGVLALSGTVVAITKNYLDRRVKGLDIEPMWSAFEEYQKQEEAEAAAEEAAQRGQ